METGDRGVELVSAAEQFAFERLRYELLGFGIPVAAQTLQTQRLAREAERAQRTTYPREAAGANRLESTSLRVLDRAHDWSAIKLHARTVEQAKHGVIWRARIGRCTGGCEPRNHGARR